MPIRKTVPLFVAVVCAATVAAAHQGVQNPAVKARMDSMKAMGDAVKVVGLMVRGQAEFDAEEVSEAVDRLRREAARTRSLFETPQTDPRMEAVPDLWDSWDDFVARDRALRRLLDEPHPESRDAARLWLAGVGEACAACHEDYRE